MLKKTMDILDIYASINILNKSLKNGIIDNIYGTRYYWILKIHSAIGKILLKIEPGVRIHLSRVEPEKKVLDKLTLYLRKTIRRARIDSFNQLGWERIVEISLRTSRNYILIAEIVPRGVLVILDNERKILYSSRFVEMKDRAIKIGKTYVPPPGGLDRDTYFNSLHDRILRGKDLVRGIVKEWGLPGYIAEEILYRAGLIDMKNADPRSVSSSDVEKIIEIYLKLVNEASIGEGYVVNFDNEQKLYTCYNPLVYREYYDAEVYGPQPLIDVLDSYYTLLENMRIDEEIAKLKNTEIIKLKKSVEDTKRLVEEYRSKQYDYWENYIILSRNYVYVVEALECANRVREENGWDKIVELCRNIVNVEKDKGLIYVKLDNKIISLDIRLDASKNINMYMIKAGEYRSKAEKGLETINELESRLTMLEKTNMLGTYRETTVVKPRLWFEKYHWLFTRNGLLAIGGRNADQNESIVKKHMEPQDIFIHADIQGAPVVVLKTGSRDVSVEDIGDAAIITVCYSKAWRAGFGYLDFYWVKGEQVSKKAPSGEYLGKGAFMIYGERKYGRCELKLALGVEKLDDPIYGTYFRVIIGSEETVSRRSIIYAVLTPGDLSIEKTAQHIHRFFMEKLEVFKGYVNLNEVLDKIPGPSRILEVKTVN
ncbi:MAG: ribosome rescue protein RqcH [Desulfurococcaceae archaeon]